MKDLHDVFVVVPNETKVSFTNIDSGGKIPEITGSDPFEGLSVYNNETKYYRLEKTVFAEPLVPVIIEENPHENDEDEITFVHNVTVQKRAGKRAKYHVDIDPQNPVCPQPSCGRTFSNTTLLKAHIRKVHCADRQRYRCNVCPNTYAARYLLQRHTAVHEKRKVPCPVCCCLLSERTSMAAHMRTHTQPAAHACGHCGARFTRAATTRQHAATCRLRPATATRGDESSG